MSAFRCLQRLCGLSLPETAEILNVRLDTVKAWSSGRRRAPAGAITDLRERWHHIQKVGDTLSAEAAKLLAQHGGGVEELTIVFSATATQAKKRLLDAVSELEAAIGLAIAGLPEDLDVVVDPAAASGQSLLVMAARDVVPSLRGTG